MRFRAEIAYVRGINKWHPRLPYKTRPQSVVLRPWSTSHPLSKAVEPVAL